VALLLGCDPRRAEEAVALLIEVAGTGHPLALDMLDAFRDKPQPAEAGGRVAGQLSQVAAQFAWDLAFVARDHGADAHACAFFRGAARGGKREAAIELATMVTADTDPELAGWLAQIGAEEATGRHHASKR
jgi:hypothetical protein